MFSGSNRLPLTLYRAGAVSMEVTIKMNHPNATQRTFIALDADLSVREELGAWLRGAQAGRQLRAVRPANMHLTLAFLGERDDAEISLVAGILATHADLAPRLAVGAPVWLPARRPRVLAVEIRPLDERLIELQGRIADSLGRTLDWKRPRSFRPHITVARIGRAGSPRLEPLPPTPQLEFTAGSLTLYRSFLLPEGAEYRALNSWSLTET